VAAIQTPARNQRCNDNDEQLRSGQTLHGEPSNGCVALTTPTLSVRIEEVTSTTTT
jgi:hypothetical protein